MVWEEEDKDGGPVRLFKDTGKLWAEAYVGPVSLRLRHN